MPDPLFHRVPSIAKLFYGKFNGALFLHALRARQENDQLVHLVQYINKWI